LLIWSFGDVTVASPVTSTGLGFREGIGDLQALTKGTGGERGIRTPDTRKGIHAFEARAFSHSAISPRRQFLSFYQGSCYLEFSPPTSLNRTGLNLLTQTKYAVFGRVAGELDVEAAATQISAKVFGWQVESEDGFLL
jgi:hypothetical protein